MVHRITREESGKISFGSAEIVYAMKYYLMFV